MFSRKLTAGLGFMLAFAFCANAQLNFGNVLHDVKNNVQTVKSTVDAVTPDSKKEEKQETAPGDTVKKTTSANPENGTTKNLAIGDEGSNNNEKKGNQMKEFIKDSKDNSGKEKPYSTGSGITPVSNLAIGDQGTVEDKKTNKNNKNNNFQENQQNNNNNPNTVNPK